MTRGRLHTASHSVKRGETLTVKGNPFEQDNMAVRTARITAEYEDARHPIKVKDYVGEHQALREEILKLSLFPNLYNKGTVRMSD
jgi:hypothetical protein